MTISEYFSLCLNVLKDFRVIVTAVVVILVIEFAKYITSYRKKAEPVVVKRVEKAKTEESPAEVKENPPDMSENDTN